MDIQRFAIGFEKRDRARLHELWDEVIDSEQWAHGAMNERFEHAWSAWNGLPAVAVSGWLGGEGGSVPASWAGPSAEPPSGLNGGQSSVSRHM